MVGRVSVTHSGQQTVLTVPRPTKRQPRLRPASTVWKHQWRSGRFERCADCRGARTFCSRKNPRKVRTYRKQYPILSLTGICRSVHAKAAGAFGDFEALEDITDLTDAKFLQKGKKSKLLTRISTVGGEKGSSDTVRDVRGWATKIYTEEGIQDFVFNDLPVFFVRDPIKFPSMNRSHKRHPRTNVPDNSMFWDFHVNNPEGIHALMHLFGTRGIPESLRHINGFGVHTYTLNKADGSYVYVKWHFKPEGGIKTMDPKRAMRLAGSEPDYHVKDLFNAIERGDYPSWLVYIQVIKPEEVKNAPIDIFDDTYTWPYDKYPLRKIARFTLNKNVSNIDICCMDFRVGRQTLMACSRTTTSRTLNKLVSPHQIWFLASALQQTPSSKLACSRIPMLIATGSDQITSSSHPIARPVTFMRHTLEMDPAL